jgi:hypothetical protein
VEAKTMEGWTTRIWRRWWRGKGRELGGDGGGVEDEIWRRWWRGEEREYGGDCGRMEGKNRVEMER